MAGDTPRWHKNFTRQCNLIFDTIAARYAVEKEYCTDYLARFDFGILLAFPKMKSVIIVTTMQPRFVC